jgi:hypothetical protein
VLQDDVVKFFFDPPSPTRLEHVLAEGKGKAKEHREVDEGDNTITFTSNDEDEETLQERFQLRSRFS